MSLLSSLLVLVLAGQTSTVDLSSLGWGIVTRPVAVELDGNPHTTEWLIGRLFSTKARLVAVRADGTMCAGPWFDTDHTWTLETIAGRSAFTRLVWPTFEIRWLEMPTCP